MLVNRLGPGLNKKLFLGVVFSVIKNELVRWVPGLCSSWAKRPSSGTQSIALSAIRHQEIQSQTFFLLTKAFTV